MSNPAINQAENPPRGWERVLLDNLARRGSGHTPSKSHPDYWHGGIKWISLADSDRLDRVYIESTFATISQKGLANSSAVMHPAGTVVLSRDAGVGKSAVMHSEMAVSQHFIAWNCGPELNNIFLYYTLQHKKREFERIAAGSTIKTIGLPYFKELTILKPLKEEQDHIADALFDADALIDSLEQLLTKKRQIKQGAMQELLTGKRRLPGFREPWCDGTLGQVIAELDAGVSVNSDVLEGGVGVPSVIKTSAIKGGIFDPSECKPIVSADLARATTQPRRETLLISRMNTPDLVGEVGYVDQDYDWLYLPDRIWMTRMRSSDCVSVRWLGYLLSSTPYKQRIADTATGTSGSMKNIAKGALLGVPVSFPRVEEQAAIARVLSDMDKDISAIESRLIKARNLKQAMAQALLTGRIRLVEPAA